MSNISLLVKKHKFCFYYSVKYSFGGNYQLSNQCNTCDLIFADDETVLFCDKNFLICRYNVTNYGIYTSIDNISYKLLKDLPKEFKNIFEYISIDKIK